MTEASGAKTSVEQTLAEAAKQTDAAKDVGKVRTPKDTADKLGGGKAAAEKPAKEPKAKKERDPNAPVRSRILPSSEESTIHISEEQAEKIAKYKGQRADFAKPLAEGKTIAQYLLDGGDKGFLSFYVRDGACSIKEFKPADSKVEGKTVGKTEDAEKAE